MMGQAEAPDEPLFHPARLSDRKSQGTCSVRQDVRYVLLVVLIALLVFLSNQLWLLFTGVPLF
jgi:hypothetical protein